MNAASPASLSRPLSDIEMAMLRPLRTVSDSTAFGGVLPVLVRGVSEADLREACARVSRARPMARATVLWKGDDAFLAAMDDLTVPLDVVPAAGPHDFSKVVERVFASPTPVKPLARVTFAPVRDTDTAWVLLHLHHAVCDYAAAIDMAYAVLAATGEEQLEPIDELPRPLSDFIAPDVFAAAAPRAHEVMSRGLIRSSAPVATPRVDPSEHTPSAFVCHAALSAEEASRVAARAKSEGGSLLAAVAAGFVMATSRELRRNQKVAIELPFGLHRFLGSDVRHKGGSYASVVFSLLDPSVGFWDVARAIWADHAATTDSLTHAVAPLVALSRTFESFLVAGKLPSISPPDFTLQSVGRVPWPVRVGKAEILRVPGCSYCEEGERTVAMSSFGGRLELSVSTRDFAYSRANLVSWLNDGIMNLLMACSIEP